VTPVVSRRPLPSASTASAAVIGGLHPARLPVDARAATLAELSARAGNRAVAAFVSDVRADMPQDPPEGVRRIREVARGGGTLGHCRFSIDPTEPLFRLPSPTQVEGGYAVKPNRTRAPQPEFEVRWPTPGRHIMYEGRTERGAQANTYLQVTQDWSDRILVGETEHVDDQTIAWEKTWKRVADEVNRLADGQPLRGATPEAATRAAWQRFVAALPPLLRPEGRDPTDEAQRARWGFDQTSAPFRQLVGESKLQRDTSRWHWPEAQLKTMEGDNEVREIVPGNSRIPGTRPPELMEAAWNRLESAAGGGGGSRRRR
jgi:hypothetical protein